MTLLGQRSLRLKYLLSGNHGGVWGEEPSGAGDCIVLRSTDQTADGRWQIKEPALRSLSTSERRRFNLVEDDVLVTKSSGSEAHIGKATLVGRDVAALEPAYSNFMQRLRPGPDLDARFLWYLLQSNWTREQLSLFSTTTTGLSNLTGPQLGLIEVPATTRTMQRAIADYLDRETAQIDAFIAKNEQLIALLTERRASSVVELIGSHEMIPLKRLVSPQRPLTYGILQCGEPVDSGIPYIGPSDLPGEGRSPVLEALRRTTPEIAAAYMRSVLEAGDIVVSIGPAFGRVGVVSADLTGANLTQDTVRVAAVPAMIDSTYLVWVLSSRIAADYWDYEILGATFRRLNLGTLGETPIPYPPLSEQRRIAVDIAGAVARLDSTIAVATQTVELARERRAALISAAVTGKIDIDASDPLEETA